VLTDKHITFKQIPKDSDRSSSGARSQDARDTSISNGFLSAQRPRHCTSAHAAEQAQETTSTHPTEDISSQAEQVQTLYSPQGRDGEAAPSLSAIHNPHRMTTFAVSKQKKS